jgi:hypothetical protein
MEFIKVTVLTARVNGNHYVASVVQRIESLAQIEISTAQKNISTARIKISTAQKVRPRMTPVNQQMVSITQKGTSGALISHHLFFLLFRFPKRNEIHFADFCLISFRIFYVWFRIIVSIFSFGRTVTSFRIAELKGKF